MCINKHMMSEQINLVTMSGTGGVGRWGLVAIVMRLRSVLTLIFSFELLAMLRKCQALACECEMSKN